MILLMNRFVLLMTLFIGFLYADNCLAKYNCQLDINGTRILGVKNCTLPAMPTFTVTAVDVLKRSGELRQYFDTKDTICGILEWFNKEIPYALTHFEGMNKKITTPLKLILSHRVGETDGGGTGRDTIHLDTDTYKVITDNLDVDVDEDELPDGNVHSHRMKYIATHEFWHFLAFNTSEGSDDKWVQEGAARNFEDIVYDDENPYTDPVFNDYIYKKHKVAFVLGEEAVAGMSYSGFLFYKLLDNKCAYPDIYTALQEKSKKLKERIMALSVHCAGMPDVNGDKLAGAFVFYNWAMQYVKDIGVFDSGEPKKSKVHPNIFKGSYLTIDHSKFNETIDLAKEGNVTQLPPFSAKSFLITHETLRSCRDINMTFDGENIKLTAVRVRPDGSSDVSDNFTLEGNNTIPYRLSKQDKSGGLFVTLTNTTDVSRNLKMLSLNKSNRQNPLLTPHSGAVEVTITWKNSANDFDLDVGWNAGKHDVKDTGCPIEHFYVDTEYDIYPGTYPIHITHKKELDDESALIPEKVTMMVKVHAKPTRIYTIDINQIEDLDIGHVADIDVKYKNGEIVPSIEPDPQLPDPIIAPDDDKECHVGNWCDEPGSGSGNGGGGSAGGNGGGNGGGGSHGGGYSCGDIPCEYKIIPYLKQLLFGPIAGAELKLYKVSGKTLLYEGNTTEGDALYSAGLIEVPDTIVDHLENEALYLLEATGGVDIDHDDDMRIDPIFTANKGTMHLLITGKEAKEIGFKMNVLTEIAYQVTKDMIDNNTTQEIVAKLHEISLRLLKEKIYRDTEGTLGYKDLLYWLPTIHRDTLFADYDGMVKPLIENLFADRDIYRQAYNIVYLPSDSVPILQSKRYDIDEELPAGSKVGNVVVLSDGSSSIEKYSLDGNGSENFKIESDGTIVVADNADLDYEKRTYYRLYVAAINEDGKSKPVEIVIQLHNIHDSPELSSAQYYDVYENTPVGERVVEISFDEGSSPLHVAELLGGLHEYFTAEVHENNVSIKIAKPLLKFVAHRAYRFELQVSNKTEKSKKIPLTIVLRDRRDIPRLANTNLYVDENATEGTLIGHIHIISDGYSPIIKYKTVQSWQNSWPAGYFRIDNNGTVYLEKNATLDYETQRSFEAYVVAVNAIGESKRALLRVNVRDVPDVPPDCHNQTIDIDPVGKGVAVGTIIGYGYCFHGDSSITSLELKPSDSPFEAIMKGRYIAIRLKESLEFTNNYEYNLTLTVGNKTGFDILPVHIVINKHSYTFDMMQGDINKIIGHIDLGKDVSNIYTTSAYTIPTNLFYVDKNGTLFRNDKKEYPPKSQHNLKVVVDYADRVKKEISVSVNVKSRIVSQLSIVGSATKVILSQDKTKAYIAVGQYYHHPNKGLVIVDITDPKDPRTLSFLATDGEVKDIALSKDGRYIYLLDTWKGLRVVDVRDASSPQFAGELPLSGGMHKVDLSEDGNRLYLAHGTKGIEVIDISDPILPKIVKTIGFLGTTENVGYGSNQRDVPSGGYMDIANDGTILYGADYHYGLQAIDISDLDHPRSIYSESLRKIVDNESHVPTDIHFFKNERLLLINSDIDMSVETYLLEKENRIKKILKNFAAYNFTRFQLLEGNLAYDGQNGLKIYDAYNPIFLHRILDMDLNGQSYNLVLDNNRSLAFIANTDKGLTIVDLSGVEQPIHYEPVIAGINIDIAEENLSLIDPDTILGQVTILKTGSSPIAKMRTGLPKHNNGEVDCGYTYYSQFIDKRCENDYSYFNVDENGHIHISDKDALKFENIGNMAPFGVYAENEDGYISRQAKVMVKIAPNPDWDLQFQKSVIKIDSNVSVGTVIANVLYRPSKREVFLFDLYQPSYWCSAGNIEEENGHGEYNYPNLITHYCTKSDYFEIDENGNISITQIPPEGNYTVNIFAVDRFGLKVLENQKIEVAKP